MAWIQRATGRTALLQRAPGFDRAGRLALAFLLVLTLAMMRRLPVVDIVHQPAFALLWVVGIAQDYQLFNWIDSKNYYVTHRVSAATLREGKRQLEAAAVFRRPCGVSCCRPTCAMCGGCRIRASIAQHSSSVFLSVWRNASAVYTRQPTPLQYSRSFTASSHAMSISRKAGNNSGCNFNVCRNRRCCVVPLCSPALL